MGKLGMLCALILVLMIPSCRMVASVHMSFESDLTGIVQFRPFNFVIVQYQIYSHSHVPDMFQCARPCGHSYLETPAAKGGGNTLRSLDRDAAQELQNTSPPSV